MTPHEALRQQVARAIHASDLRWDAEWYGPTVLNETLEQSGDKAQYLQAADAVLAVIRDRVEALPRYGMNVEQDATEWLSPDREGDWMRWADVLALFEEQA